MSHFVKQFKGAQRGARLHSKDGIGDATCALSGAADVPGGRNSRALAFIYMQVGRLPSRGEGSGPDSHQSPESRAAGAPKGEDSWVSCGLVGQDAKFPQFRFFFQSPREAADEPRVMAVGDLLRHPRPQLGLQRRRMERKVLCSALIWRPSPGVRPVNPGRQPHGGQDLAAVSGWAGDGWPRALQSIFTRHFLEQIPRPPAFPGC